MSDHCQFSAVTKNCEMSTEVVEQGFNVICFFFQAEDGIRDVAVTGVQTCALPILRVGHLWVLFEERLQYVDAPLSIAGVNQRKAHGVGNLGIVVAALPQRNQCFGRAAVILMEKTAQAEQRAYILTLRLAGQGGLQRCDSIGVILALELGKPKVELQVWQPRVPGCGLRQPLCRSLGGWL